VDINSIVGEPVEIPQDAPEPSPAPAPAEAPAPAPTPEPAPAPQPEPTTPPTGFAPLAALHEERARRRNAEQRAEQVEALQRQIAEMQRTLQPAPAMPDPNENPVGYLAHQQQQVQQQVQHLVQQSQQQAQQAQVAAAEAALATRIRSAEAGFAAAQPDYQQALDHVHNLRVRELQLLGSDPETAAMQSQREMREAAFFHAANGRNPAEVFYGLAKVRGHSSKPAAAAPTAAEQLAAAQKGVAAAASLGGGSGAVVGQMDIRRLATMSDKEFSSVSEDQWRKAMGG
jgi:hypothetical protein